MKRALILSLVGIAASTILTGCLNLQLGVGTTNRPQSPTIGQQLLDLQRAKEAQAINDAQYRAEKARLPNEK